jgi:predicted O-methyltransferase YrrM
VFGIIGFDSWLPDCADLISPSEDLLMVVLSMLMKIFRKLPPVSALIAEREALLKAQGSFPAGHFYSPIVSLDEVRKDQDRIFSAKIPAIIPGIDLNEQGQLALLKVFEGLYATINFPEHKTEDFRYCYQNPAYSYSDAIVLHCMMRHLRPRKIVEVGSGYSSCMMLDTNDRFLDGATTLTFLDPYPQLLKSLMWPADLEKHKILPLRLQEMPLETIAHLEENDILFIDSTHVSKTGSDVNRLLFEILPALNRGVYIHIHDIFYPFEYPQEWVFLGRSWNEIYALRAFLQYNTKFTIQFMNTYLQHFHASRFAEHMPLCLKNPGGSIWLQKQ